LAAHLPAWLACPARSRAARHHERAALAGLARGFGIALEVAGTPAPGATLFVANHVGWADVAVLGGVLDADFVSRADVAEWPLIGALARRVAPVFVERDRRLDSRTQAQAIRARLAGGRSVLLFAEGTTSDGSDVLPFRSSLLAAADAAEAVQPVMLRYLAPDGAALAPARMREIAWIGDDPLLPNVLALARSPVLAAIRFLPPLPTSIGRKGLATEARAAIRAAYAATPNRPRYRAEIAATGTTRNTSTVLN
jgi:1-acyl-sn-glycerol-3-phosphate acyltransferase